MPHSEPMLTINLGFTEESIREQLLRQGFKIGVQEGRRLQRIRQAMNTLRVTGMLKGGEVTRVEKRLLDLVEKAMG